MSKDSVIEFVPVELEYYSFGISKSSKINISAGNTTVSIYKLTDTLEINFITIDTNTF